ncbi:MAG: dephospho-CoA kinase [Granulosicoccus sp.]
MMLIGLTGGIASGKTTVSDCFANLGVPLLDADLLAREVVLPGSEGLEALVAYFTTAILTATGELDRAKLRHIVFNNPADRAFLDKTLHPLIRQLSDRRIDEARDQHYPYLIYAIPLLLETDQISRFDRVIVVDVPQSLQIERLKRRDNSTSEEVTLILAAQATRNERLHIADDVIDNAGSIADTRQQVIALHEQYMTLAQQSG